MTAPCRRLAAVLRIRTLQERSARGELARTRRDHQHAVAVERRTWEMIDELAAPVARGVNADPLAGRHAQVTAGLLSTHPLRAETERTHESMDVAKADLAQYIDDLGNDGVGGHEQKTTIRLTTHSTTLVGQLEAEARVGAAVRVTPSA